MSCASEAKIKRQKQDRQGDERAYEWVLQIYEGDSVLAVLEQSQNKKSKKKKYTGTLKEKGPDLAETGQLLLSSPHEA